MAATQIDWGRLAALAAVHLHWSPDIFWAATPKEYLAAWQVKFGAAPKPMSRMQMTTLMTQFPDGEEP